MHPKRHIVKHQRLYGVVVAACMALTGCAAPGNDPSLSAEENQLRSAHARFTQTVGEGAVTGALLGGVAGALLGGRNRLAAAAIGATAGGALGAGAGYLVARNNAARTHSEADYQAAITEAQQSAATFRASADSANRLAANAEAELNALDAQYRSRQITADVYRARAAHYQSVNKQLTDVASDAQKEVTSLRTLANGAGSNSSALLAAASDDESSQQAIQARAAQVAQLLARVPQGSI